MPKRAKSNEVVVIIRKWSVTNGMDGETCSDFKSNDTELWCQFAAVPDCVDRTIVCSDPPHPNRGKISVTNKPNPNHDKEYLTR